MDTDTHTLLGVIELKSGSMPQDVKISPDGGVWYRYSLGHTGVLR